MATTVIVTAKIDQAAKLVKLEGSRLPDPARHDDTFLVRGGDTLQWNLRDAAGNPFPDSKVPKARVVFTGPFPGPVPLIEPKGNVNVLDSKGDVITGTVSDAAADGRYEYDFKLVTGGAETHLNCRWDRQPSPTGAAGGKKSKGP